MRGIQAAAAPVLGLLLLVTGIECSPARAEGFMLLPCGTAPQTNPEKPCDGSTPTNPPGQKPSTGMQPATPLPLQMLAPSQRAGGNPARPSGPPAAALTPPPAGHSNPVKPIVPVPGD
ncbi:hypothetical protein [Nocardia brevicatena]|uniref:hypothetical protein n=1 Tax=Nocardia brevicatena TaxID=37327 RepID=UPI000312EB44|nr:hypothetical protein [Nocardia brevicatena]